MAAFGGLMDSGEGSSQAFGGLMESGAPPSPAPSTTPPPSPDSFLPAQAKDTWERFKSHQFANVQSAVDLFKQAHKDFVESGKAPGKELEGAKSVGEAVLGAMQYIWSPIQSLVSTAVTDPTAIAATKIAKATGGTPEQVKDFTHFMDTVYQTAAGFAGGAEATAEHPVPKAHAAAKVERAFDDLARKAPDTAMKVADAVGEANPKVGEKMRIRIMEAKPGEKPRVRIVDSKEAGVEAAKSEIGLRSYIGVEDEDMASPWSVIDAHLTAHLNQLDASRTSTTTHDLLDRMLDIANKTGSPVYTRAILQKLRARIDNIPVHVQDLHALGYEGVYSHVPATGRHWIELDPRGTRLLPAETAVHEMFHAVTAKYVRANPLDEDVLALKKMLVEARAAEASKQVNALDLFASSTKSHYGLWGDERAAKPDEFITEAISNPRFQSWLVKNMKSPASLAGKIFHAIGRVARKALGITDPNEGLFLDKVLHHAMNIVEKQHQTIPKVSLPAEATLEQTTSGVRSAMRETYEALGSARGESPREALQKAFSFTRKVPGVAFAEGKLSEYWRQIVETVNPEAIGPQAKVAGAALAKRISILAHRDSAFYHDSIPRRELWNKRPQDALKFIAGFEKGQAFTDPDLRDAAEGYKKWADMIYQQDKATGLEYDPVDHYMPHIFENPKEVETWLIRKYGTSWTKPGFTKDRAFDLYEEAMAAGFKPKYTNPEDIMLARQHASDVAQMRVQTLRDLESLGIAEKISKGGKMPDWPAKRISSPTGESYWVHEDAARVLHNAFNTQTLWSMKGLGGDLFRGTMALKNTLVPIKLGLSLYHPLHVQTIDNATEMVRATKGLLAGEESAAQWMGRMAKAITYHDLWSAPKSGSRILKAFQGKIKPDQLSAADQDSLRLMAEGGFAPEMSAQYKTRARQNFKDALDRRSLTAAWHAPFAAVSYLQKPIFEVWIPSLKIASYLKDAKQAMELDPELASNPAKRLTALRKLSKSVDNRYGEMAYNTLFWNRWVKDLAVGNTLSLGWQLGFIREYGGGMMDMAKALSEEGGLAKKAREGMLDRPLFITFYTAQALAYGGLMTYLMTGKTPASLLDYVYPQTGEVEKDGRPSRANTMFYPREFMSFYKRAQEGGVGKAAKETVESKASGMIGLMREWATGVDAFGDEIRDPNAPAYKKLEQTLVSTLPEIEPISVKALDKYGGMEPTKAKALAFAGFTPAPKYITESPVEAKINQLYQTYYAPKQTPYDRAQTSADARKLRAAYDKDDMDTYFNVMQEMQDKFGLTGKEVRKLTISMARGTDPMIHKFTQLDWRQQKNLLDQMTPEERDRFLPHANVQHLRYSYEPPEGQR